MYRVRWIMTWLGVGWALPLTTTRAAEAPQSSEPAPFAVAMNKRFTDPHADVQQFVKHFENDSREIYVKRHEITRAVGLRPGNAVADIGAGTGLFSLLFAEQVGPKGTVYAVDIGPAFVDYIGNRAKQQGYGSVIKSVLNTQDSARLAPGSLNVAFLCDTYHHFEHPEKMLASIHDALRPGGRLVIIDFDLREKSSEFVKLRARAPQEIYRREIAAAGFERIATKTGPTLQDKFYAEFRRVAQAGVSNNNVALRQDQIPGIAIGKDASAALARRSLQKTKMSQKNGFSTRNASHAGGHFGSRDIYGSSCDTIISASVLRICKKSGIGPKYAMARSARAVAMDS